MYAPFVSLADFQTTRPNELVYSVWRLDAATAAQAKGLVDKAKTAEAYGLSGQGCFDRRFADLLGLDESYAQGDWDIQRAHETVIAAGFPSTLDVTPRRSELRRLLLAVTGRRFRQTGGTVDGMIRDVFTWATGAMGWHYDSLSLQHTAESHEQLGRRGDRARHHDHGGLGQ